MGDEDQTKLCTNCERQIPAGNYTIHSVHCARNLKVCQKCKEPVPLNDMKKHLENVACKQCGERMQACDLSPHQREACPQTSITCNHCEIQLARTLMRDHEAYCGARTERCDECGELVMIKYRKLHEESNHGFLKLDDEPGPQPSWMSSNVESASMIPKPSASVKPAPKPVKSITPYSHESRRTSEQRALSHSSASSSSRNVQSARAESSTFLANAQSSTSVSNAQSSLMNSQNGESIVSQNLRNSSARVTNSRNNSVEQDDQILNDRSVVEINGRNASALQEKLRNRQRSRNSEIPSSSLGASAAQSSTSNGVASDNNHGLRASKGAIKKYQAPQPPNAKKSKDGNRKQNQNAVANVQNLTDAPSASFKHIRDVPMYAATLREQNQIKEREIQTEINLAQGLPPVLNPAQKLDKLRKMSALQNMDFDRDIQNKQTNKKSNVNSLNDMSLTPMSEDELLKRLQKQNINMEKNVVNKGVNLNRRGSNDKNAGVKNIKNSTASSSQRDVNLSTANDDHYYEPVNSGLWDPPAVNAAASSSVGSDTDRVANVRLRSDNNANNRSTNQQVDRFSEIKNDLRVLRKELKECSSPLEVRRPSDTSNIQPQPILARVFQDQGAQANAQRSIAQQKVARAWSGGNSTSNETQNVRNPTRKEDEKRRNRVRNDSLDGDLGVICKFCNKSVPQIELVDHEIYCQIRMRRQSSERRTPLEDPLRVSNLFDPLLPRQVLQPPRNMPRNDFMEIPSDLDGVMLPCEFCNQIIPAHDFVTHETGCNPLETSILPPSANRTPERETNPQPQVPYTPVKNVNVERSNLTRLAKNVAKYQRNSDRQSNRQEYEDNPFERNGQNIYETPGAHFPHVINRDPRDEINAEGTFGYGEEEVQLPCEFCMTLMPAEMLMLHQQTCEAQ